MSKEISSEEKKQLFKVLKSRFEKNMNRHEGVKWEDVEVRLEARPNKIWSLNEMERTGGEPDVVAFESESGEYIFYDCSAESPKGTQKCLL